MTRSGPVILVATDDSVSRSYLTDGLAVRRHKVVLASDGVEAIHVFSRRPVDLAVLDISRTAPGSVEVCTRIRQVSSIPIIILSTRSEEHDKVVALDRGADDYLTKPFGMGELVARINAALRRSGGAAAPNRHTGFGDVQIDFSARRAWRGNEEVQLTSTEFTLLSLLMRNSDRVLNHRYLLAAVWGSTYTGEREYLRVYICRLRQKLEQNARTPRHILTVPGVGYRFSSGAEQLYGQKESRLRGSTRVRPSSLAAGTVHIHPVPAPSDCSAAALTPSGR